MYTLTELSRRTGIPESTLRRYRDRFPTFFPAQGRGRQKLYDKEAEEIFRTIKGLFDRGLSAEQVYEELRRRYSETLTVEVETAQSLSSSSGESHQALQEIRPLLQAFVEGQRKLAEVLERLDRKLELTAKERELLEHAQEENRRLAQDLKKELEASKRRAQEQLREAERHWSRQLGLLGLFYGLLLLLALGLLLTRDLWVPTVRTLFTP